MSLSLKEIAANCISLSPPFFPPFSVVRDVFGYSAPRRTMSLRRQLQLVQGQSFGVNVILVGEEDFTTDDIEEIESAIQITREIYAAVDFGIRKLEWHGISKADAGQYVIIDSSSEANDLTDDFTISNDFLDLFVVRSMNGADGWSSINGPCNKDAPDVMTGSVSSLNGPVDNSGNTFAHEMGHYFGLNHVADPDNFIGNNGASDSNTKIEISQGDTMKKHCFADDVC